MCGLIAAIGQLKKEDENAFTQLLIIDSLRGVDSTGMFTITSTKNLSVAKQVGNPYELINTKAFDKAISGLQRVMVGHNRYATQGAVNKRNAHPFEFDNVIGVHNGTLRNKYTLLNAQSYTVDSENLYHHIDEKGLASAMSNLDGAWALIWWDKVMSKLNILRNAERPLYHLETKAGNVFMASEAWMLEGVLSRNNIAYEGKPQLFETDYLHTIDIDLKTGSIVKIEKRLSKSGYQPPVVYNNGYFPKPAAPAPAPAPATNVKNLPPPVAKPLTTGKKHLFEILGHSTDSHGQMYFDVASESYPYDDIRYYYQHMEGNPLDCISEFFEASLMPNAVLSTTGRFYRIYNQSVDWLKGEQDEVHCAWCNATVDTKATHGKTPDGSLLCLDCSSDPEIKEYISFNLVNA